MRHALPCPMHSRQQQHTDHQMCQAPTSAAHPAYKRSSSQPAKASSNSIDPTSCIEAEEGGLALYIEDRGAQAVAQKIACFVLVRMRMQH